MRPKPLTIERPLNPNTPKENKRNNRRKKVWSRGVDEE
jgi:hypothetical protein